MLKRLLGTQEDTDLITGLCAHVRTHRSLTAMWRRGGRLQHQGRAEPTHRHLGRCPVPLLRGGPRV